MGARAGGQDNVIGLAGTAVQMVWGIVIVADTTGEWHTCRNKGRFASKENI